MVNNLKLLIKSNIKTFISILLLTMLGVGFLVGMKNAVPSLKYTVDYYFDEYNVYDVELISSIGFNNEDVKTFSEIDGIKKIIGSYNHDFLVNGKNGNYVLRAHSYINEDDTINKLELLVGHLPEDNNQIVVEDKLFESQNYKLCDTITLKSDLLRSEELEIVGVIKSPLYLSSNKGSTNLLSGSVNYYAYINYNNVNSELFSSVYIKLDENANIDNVISLIKEKGKDILDVRYNDTIKEYTEKIEKWQSELDKKKADTEKTIQKYEQDIANAEAQILSVEKSIPTVKQAEAMLANKKKTLDDAKRELDAAKAQIDSARQQYNNAKSEYNDAVKQQNELKKQADNLKQAVNVDNENLRLENDRLRKELVSANEERKKEINRQIKENERTIKDNQEGYDFAVDYLNLYKFTLDEYKKKLDENKVLLDEKQYEYDLTYDEYNKALKTLEANSVEEIIEITKKDVANKKKFLNEKKKELEEGKVKVSKEFESYQNQLNDGKDYLKLISLSSWNINKRSDMTTYNQYINDIKRIENIGNFFPVIFYIVTVLITLTNITRIIENDRDTIGLYKALGYSNVSIGNDYLYFSILSSILGSLLGIVIGLFLIPKIFYNVYNLIYYLPEYKYSIDYGIIVIAVVIALLIVIASTYFSIKDTIKEWPTNLLRPKQNEGGKRVFLENIPSIWGRMNFTNKVTIRNMFKYPKRFVMTILGISGCISLIIAGFNIRTSISNIIPLQFGEIFDIDVEIFLKESLTRDAIQEENERIRNLEEVESTILSHIKYVYVDDGKIKANLVVPEDKDLILDFVNFKNGNNNFELSDNGAIVTKKMAKLMNIKLGDVVKIRDSGNNIFDIEVEEIVDNYVDNYIYISREYYLNVLKEQPKFNTVIVRMNDDKYNEEELSNKFNQENKVSYLIYSNTSKSIYDNITKSLNYIVYVLVISAVILAFIVLYNLNNLNVDERKREIATIKVLGFYKDETYKYIENEIKRLTVIGIFIGIFLGYIFSYILVKSCELDNLMYDYSINYMNYILAIIITIIFTIITSLLCRKNIERINMIESLKKME